MASIAVYRIETFPAQTNSHTIGLRHENWVLKPDRTFQTEDEAKEYVRMRNRLATELPNLLITLPAAERPAFVDRFCFGDEYWDLRRYFLGRPPAEKIIQALKIASLQVLH